MIITIKGADFSAKNIGTLSTWTILTSLGSGATYSGNSFVDKDGSLSATITIANGYELGSAGVSVMMGSTNVTSSAATVRGNIITISIATVTGNVTISVPTINTSGDEEPGVPEEEPDIPDTPTESTWYVDYTTLGGNFNFPNSAGAVTFSDTATYNKCVGVPINAVKVIPGGAGLVGYGRVADDGDTYTALGAFEILESDVAASGTADLAKVYKLNSTITLAAGERLAIMEYGGGYSGKIFVLTGASEDLAKARTNIRSSGSSKVDSWKLPIGIGYVAQGGN